MERRIFAVLLVGTTLLGVSAMPSTSEACDWAYCAEPADLIPQSGATIPANASLAWGPLYYAGDIEDGEQQLSLVDDAGVEVDIEIVEVDLPRFQRWGPLPRAVTPLEPLDVGREYTFLTPSSECVGEDVVEVESTFTVSAPAELPTDLGTISASSLEDTELALAEDASCTNTQNVITTKIELKLSDDALAWEDALAFETVVNGDFWGPAEFSGQGFPLGSSWVGRGEDLVFAICEENPYSEHSYLLPGTHTVQMRARIPGTDVVIETNELTLQLDCDAAGEDPTQGSEESAEETEEESEEAEETEEMEETEEESEEVPNASSSDSSSCAAVGAPLPSSVLLVVAALGLLGIRRS